MRTLFKPHCSKGLHETECKFIEPQYIWAQSRPTLGAHGSQGSPKRPWGRHFRPKNRFGLPSVRSLRGAVQDATCDPQLLSDPFSLILDDLGPMWVQFGTISRGFGHHFGIDFSKKLSSVFQVFTLQNELLLTSFNSVSRRIFFV